MNPGAGAQAKHNPRKPADTLLRRQVLTNVASIVDAPESPRLGVAVRGHRGVVELRDGDARVQILLTLHPANADHHRRRLRRRRARRQRDCDPEPARLAAGRDGNVERVAAARGLHRLLAVVRVVAVLVLLQHLQDLGPAAPVPLLGRLHPVPAPTRHDVPGEVGRRARVVRRRVSERQEGVRQRGLQRELLPCREGGRDRRAFDSAVAPLPGCQRQGRRRATDRRRDEAV